MLMSNVYSAVHCVCVLMYIAVRAKRNAYFYAQVNFNSSMYALNITTAPDQEQDQDRIRILP